MYDILDPCCGSRMFWFQKNHPAVIYGDSREEEHTLCDGRVLTINPDQIIDFRNLPYDDNSFHLVVFDPPHLKNAGDKSWTAKKYGRLGHIKIIDTKPESLRLITQEDVVLEGFPDWTPDDFIAMLCQHPKITPDTILNRIQFEYLGDES